MKIGDWLDGGDPHGADRSAAQAAWLDSWVGSREKAAVARVLDLGCGDGRTVTQATVAGCDVVGVDCNEDALAQCRSTLQQSGVDAKLILQDVLEPWTDMGSDFDLVLCLGNTFMLFWELDAATSLLTRCRTHLAPGGMVVIDDIPSEFQPEVDSGNWTTGMSPDGDLQMIWDEHDPIFTIRSGEAIDEDSWSLQGDDVRLRLWTRQSLSHVAAAAGLSGPDPPVDGPGEGAVLVMRSTQA
jgi:cyclopropane fatty-acyl-phospholipid synthase-like methyltransferase